MNPTDRAELNELRAAIILNAKKKALNDCVNLMWDCYQRVAQTPDDDRWTRIFIEARDLHQAALQDGQEIAEEERGEGNERKDAQRYSKK